MRAAIAVMAVNITNFENNRLTGRRRNFSPGYPSISIGYCGRLRSGRRFRLEILGVRVRAGRPGYLAPHDTLILVLTNPKVKHGDLAIEGVVWTSVCPRKLSREFFHGRVAASRLVEHAQPIYERSAIIWRPLDRCHQFGLRARLVAPRPLGNCNDHSCCKDDLFYLRG